MPARTTQPGTNFREFYESVAENYPEEDLVYQSLRGLVRREFVTSRVAEFKGTLLDLGCNRGAYSAKYVNGIVIGVDISKRILDVARKSSPAGFFIQGDAQELGFLKEGVIDAILCSEMLEHVLEPQKVLNQCYALLKPGGRLLLTTPNYRGRRPEWVSIGQMSGYGVRGIDGDRYFHTAFRPEELQQMATAAGFASATVGTFEKEVKYATRVPVIFCRLIEILNRLTLKQDKIDRLNSRFLEITSLSIYRLSCTLGLNDFFVRLVPEGVRSFLMAIK